MNTLKVLFFTLLTSFLLVSCEKDCDKQSTEFVQRTFEVEFVTCSLETISVMIPEDMIPKVLTSRGSYWMIGDFGCCLDEQKMLSYGFTHYNFKYDGEYIIRPGVVRFKEVK